ncbi:MAG: hypothetical protein JNM18_11710 [Planctomycetaceae bacterium]|nr:hypothetical protein [Planctomycetaceae bacterium]
MWRRIAWMIVALVTGLLFATVAEACPTCKEALKSQAKYGNLPQAYMWSILFMMSMPFLLLGSFGAYIYVLCHRNRPPVITGPAAATAPVEQEPVEV